MNFHINNSRTAKLFVVIFSLAVILTTFGCEQPTTLTNSNTGVNTAANTAANTTIANSAANTAANMPEQNKESAAKMPVTLPVLDAMFSDEAFANDLRMKVQLTDEQIDKLKNISHQATAGLKEGNDGSGSTRAAMERADKQIREVVGDSNAGKFFDFVRERWSGGEEAGNNADASKTGAAVKNSIPTDSRIVVNAPAYRMDVFQEGKLIKTYKIGIGYPEFPLPSGMRKANEIIFNPTWTPPDEPWVEASNKVKAGEKVAAADKLNPLGPIKIPIGMPSLIHGGKNPAKLGTFASHGCVGLTNKQVQAFSLDLANISGLDLSKEDVAGYEKQKTETKNVKLGKTIPVELRYQTIVVEDGKLSIFRDVYEKGTNTEENLRAILQSYGVSFDSLKEPDKAKILAGLKQMAIDAAGNPVGADDADSNGSNGNVSGNTNKSNAEAKSNTNAKSNSNDVNKSSASVTRAIKGKKEIVFNLAELKGKGYPAPVALNSGV